VKIDPFTPVAYSRIELWLVRLVFVFVCWSVFPGFTTFVEQPSPVGVAHLLDLTWLASRDAVVFGLTPLELVRAVLGIALAVFLSGIFDRYTLPIILVALVSIGTLNNSQGAITHHLQIVSLVGLGLWVFALIRPAPRRPFFGALWLARERWACFVGQQVIIAAYLTTGITKLLRSGLGWVADAQYFPLQLYKTQQMDYYNTLPEAGNDNGLDWLQEVFIESPNIARLAIGSGLLIELIAFVALFGRGWNFAVGVLFIGFHLTISAAMNLTFDENIHMLLGFFVIPAAVSFTREWSRRVTGRGRISSSP